MIQPIALNTHNGQLYTTPYNPTVRRTQSHSIKDCKQDCFEHKNLNSQSRPLFAQHLPERKRQEVSFGIGDGFKRLVFANKIPCAYSGKKFSFIDPPTVEHVKPKSWGGRSSVDNYLPVNYEWNQKRGNQPLDEFIEKFPQVAENIKKTIDKLKKIKTQNFNGQEWAENITEVIRQQTKGKLDLTA